MIVPEQAQTFFGEAMRSQGQEVDGRGSGRTLAGGFEGLKSSGPPRPGQSARPEGRWG